MRYKDLDYSTQILLITALVILLAIVMIRSATFMYRHFAGVQLQYPRNWTPAQCQFMDGFRLFTGFALSALWIAQFDAAPKMPTNWPFGFLEGLSLAVLLLLTNAWALLILPRDWESLSRATKHFNLIMSTLIVWWALMIGGTIWMLFKSSTPRVPPALHMPVVAAGAGAMVTFQRNT